MKHISIITAVILTITISSCEENAQELLDQNEIPIEQNETDNDQEPGIITIVDNLDEKEPSKEIATDDFSGSTGTEKSSSLEEITNGDGVTVKKGSTKNTVEVVNVNGKDVIAPESTNKDSVSIVNDIQRLVNEHRATVDENSLTIDDFMSNLALEHSKNLAMGSTSSHGGFETRQNAVISQFTNVGLFGENIATNQTNGKGAVTQWLESKRHRDNIENTAYTHTGIGTYQNPETGSIYYTQIFAQIN